MSQSKIGRIWWLFNEGNILNDVIIPSNIERKAARLIFKLILPKTHIILSHSRACTWLFTAYERRILNSRCELNFGLFISWHKIQLTCRFRRKKEKNTPSFGLWAFHSLNIETIAHVIYYVLHIRSHKDVWCVWKRCTYKFFGVPLSSLSHTQHPAPNQPFESQTICARKTNIIKLETKTKHWHSTAWLSKCVQVLINTKTKKSCWMRSLRTRSKYEKPKCMPTTISAADPKHNP